MKFTKKQIEQFKEDQEIDGFTLVYKSLTDPSQIDPGDSNEFEVIFGEEATGNFYRITYDEWMGSDEPIDQISDPKQVFPVQETITIYK